MKSAYVPKDQATARAVGIRPPSRFRGRAKIFFTALFCLSTAIPPLYGQSEFEPPKGGKGDQLLGSAMERSQKYQEWLVNNVDLLVSEFEKEGLPVMKGNTYKKGAYTDLKNLVAFCHHVLTREHIRRIVKVLSSSNAWPSCENSYLGLACTLTSTYSALFTKADFDDFMGMRNIVFSPRTYPSHAPGDRIMDTPRESIFDLICHNRGLPENKHVKSLLTGFLQAPSIPLWTELKEGVLRPNMSDGFLLLALATHCSWVFQKEDATALMHVPPEKQEAANEIIKELKKTRQDLFQ